MRAILISSLVLALAACQRTQAPTATPSTSTRPAAPIAEAPVAEPGSVPVTADNFGRAASDLAFANAAKHGGFGKLDHNRELTPLDKQLVVRQNRDTLYSSGVFDLDAGPVTVTLPDAGGRHVAAGVR